MTAVGVFLMGLGVWVILTTPDLSGGTLLGTVLFLLGLWITANVDRAARRRPRDSTAAAVDAAAADMVEGR